MMGRKRKIKNRSRRKTPDESKEPHFPYCTVSSHAKDRRNDTFSHWPASQAKPQHLGKKEIKPIIKRHEVIWYRL
jgi:hypothetical protein